MLHRLCEPPSITLSFNLAVVVPRRRTNHFCFSRASIGARPTQCASFTARTTGVSNPVRSPGFRTTASGTAQRVAFASGVPPDIYAFHRYTRSSTLLFCPRAGQFPAQFLGWAEGFHAGHTRPPTCSLSPVIPNNACHLCLTAAAGTELAVASSGLEVTGKWYWHFPASFAPTGVYDPKAFILHAASLGQACAHCQRFSTAASRRSLGSVSVPVCGNTLSGPVPVIALVGRYLTN